MTSTLRLTMNDGEMALYEAEPTMAARGAIVVIQEAFGVNDHIEDVTRRFAAAGYRAVAPHMFHRSGDPTFGYDDFSKVTPHMGALSQAGLLEDLDATLSHLGEAGFAPSSIGVVGFCMGGTVGFLAASHYGLGAAVSFYGGGIVEGRFGIPPLIELAPSLQTPWLGLFGDDDQGIPVDQVEALREAIAKVAVATEIVRYEGAGHGFHCDVRASYNEPAATDAWSRALAWFEAHLA